MPGRCSPPLKSHLTNENFRCLLSTRRRTAYALLQRRLCSTPNYPSLQVLQTRKLAPWHTLSCTRSPSGYFPSSSSTTSRVLYPFAKRRESSSLLISNIWIHQLRPPVTQILARLRGYLRLASQSSSVSWKWTKRRPELLAV